MNTYLIESIQKSLGHTIIENRPADPPEVIHVQEGEDLFTQAALSAVLVGLYSYSRTSSGAANLLTGDIELDWSQFIFGDHRKEVG